MKHDYVLRTCQLHCGASSVQTVWAVFNLDDELRFVALTRDQCEAWVYLINEGE